MTDYTITTDFGAKDSLPSGNAAKVIKGSEFTTEFTNIKTAVNSKADTAGDTFTGAVTFDAAVTLNADVTFDTNTMFVDVSANKVGIGNVAPATALDVTGTVTASGLTVDTDTLHVDATNNRVGIGTSSPDYPLEVSKVGTSGTGTIGLVPDSDNGHYIRYGGGGTNNNVFRLLGTGNTERMRIDSSGNVGIGTSSPESNLHVQNTSLANGVITVERDTKIKGTITAGNSTGLTIDVNNTQGGTEALRFSGNGTERMRIDSSGNLLVGKTSSGSTIEGAELHNSGSIFAVRDSNPAGAFDRKTTDGDVVQFRKDGTTVGSIGVVTSDNLYIQGNSTHHGLAFGETKIVPFKNSAYSNALCDLGETNTRFKDLYLSGGVYLGGTGSANKLDDYEEGNWTPTLIGSTSGSASLTVSQATYTKIGNTVRVACYITGANVTGLSGAVRLAGLPFSVFTYTPVTVTYCNLFSFDEADGIGGFTEAGQSYVNLVFGSSKSHIQHTSANATNGTVMFTAVYNTSA